MSYWDNSFQSTPSAWRETFSRCSLTFAGDISIHSLRMEGDLRSILPGDSQAIFQSTPSAWRETSVCFFRFPVATISIHSLRMEGDSGTGAGQPLGILFQSTPSAWRETSQFQCSFSCQKHFNPLPPHGGRQLLTLSRDDAFLFQSTPSAWRET